tara:strand:+ start:402 stop:758 length:357 start_codon:yes stop_codon:yes gene_type:complete
MAKSYKFSRRDKNRFRKVYRYIRKKPVYDYFTTGKYETIVGSVDFSDESGPVTYTYPSGTSFATVPVITAIAVDTTGDGSGHAGVNIFVSAVTTSLVRFSSSAPFTGKVHFQIISQDS